VKNRNKVAKNKEKYKKDGFFNEIIYNLILKLINKIYDIN